MVNHTRAWISKYIEMLWERKSLKLVELNSWKLIADECISIQQPTKSQINGFCI